MPGVPFSRPDGRPPWRARLPRSGRPPSVCCRPTRSRLRSRRPIERRRTPGGEARETGAAEPRRSPRSRPPRPASAASTRHSGSSSSMSGSTKPPPWKLTWTGRGVSGGGRVHDGTGGGDGRRDGQLVADPGVFGVPSVQVLGGVAVREQAAENLPHSGGGRGQRVPGEQRHGGSVQLTGTRGGRHRLGVSEPVATGPWTPNRLSSAVPEYCPAPPEERAWPGGGEGHLAAPCASAGAVTSPWGRQARCRTTASATALALLGFWPVMRRSSSTTCGANAVSAVP